MISYLFFKGYLHDIWTFSVGYDDLWDIDPLGNEVVKEISKTLFSLKIRKCRIFSLFIYF